MLRKALGAIIGPIAYKLDPVRTGQQVLRGLLLREGVDAQFLPLAVTEELAERAHKFSCAFAKALGKTVIEHYYETLELYAMQIRDVLHQPDRSGKYFRDMETVISVLNRHQVHYPAIGD